MAIGLIYKVHLAIVSIGTPIRGHRSGSWRVAYSAELCLLVNVPNIPSLILSQFCVIGIPPKRRCRYLVVASYLLQKVGCTCLNLRLLRVGSPRRPASGRILRQDRPAEAGVSLALGLDQCLVCERAGSCVMTLYFLIASLEFVSNLLKLLTSLYKVRYYRLILFLLTLNQPDKVLHQFLLLVDEGRLEGIQLATVLGLGLIPA